MAWWNNKTEKEIPRIPAQVIWRTTLNPVCSEREIQGYTRWIALHSRSSDKDLYSIRTEILAEAQKHAAQQGTRETFKLSKKLLSHVFDHVCYAINLEKEIIYIDLMLEANIAALNGEKISSLRANLASAKPPDFGFDFNGGYDLTKSREEIRKQFMPPNGYDVNAPMWKSFLKYEEFLSSLIRYDLAEDKWNRRVQENDWSFEYNYGGRYWTDEAHERYLMAHGNYRGWGDGWSNNFTTD